MRKWLKRTLFAAIALMLLMVGLRFWALYGAMQHVGDAALGQYLGPADAPLERTVVEFMDYRCPACRKTAAAVDDFHARHPDVKIVIKHVPVFGEDSVREARMALAAGKQGRFEAMYRILITRDEPVAEEEIDGIAAAAGAEPAQLRADMESSVVTDEIVAALNAAQAFRLKATPGFLINGKLFTATMKAITADDLDRALSHGTAGGK